MGCIFSICKKKVIQVEESEAGSIQGDSFVELNQKSQMTPTGQNYFEVDERNDNYFYGMQHYNKLRSSLSQIINSNINNKLSKEHAEPILDLLRLKFSNYQNQIQEESRKYRKYLKDLTTPYKISEINSETDNENSGTHQMDVRVITQTPDLRVHSIQPPNNESQLSSSNNNNNREEKENMKSGSEQLGEYNQKGGVEDGQNSSPLKYYKGESQANIEGYQNNNSVNINRKSNFDDSKNLPRDKKGGDDSSLDDIQISEMLKKNLNFTQTNVTPLNKQRRQTDRFSNKQGLENGGSDQAFEKKNTEQTSSQNRDSIIQSSLVKPYINSINNNNNSILKNFYSEKINLIKPKQVVVDLQQAKLLLSAKGEEVQLRISTKSKSFDTQKLPEDDLKFFKVFQINLEEDEDEFKIQFIQNEIELTQPQTFKTAELLDQKIYIKNLNFKLQKTQQYAAILLIRVQYIHDIQAIQRYWIDETEARLKQIDQIKNYISQRKPTPMGNNSQKYEIQNTLNNVQTLISNDFNSHSNNDHDDGSSYFDNQFYAK